MKLGDRPEFFERFLALLQDLLARTSRPHWLIVDEAHHLLPPTRDPASLSLSHWL